MERNLIRARRKELGLTQQQLAEMVGTSQQQVQRIESGVQTARLKLASDLAHCLQTTLDELFPALGSSRRASGRRSKSEKFADTKDLFEKAGIDPDPLDWTLKFEIRGCGERQYPVTSYDKDRISRIIRERTFKFFVFNSHDRRVAIRLSSINSCNFLFDPWTAPEAERDIKFDVEVTFKGSDKSVCFGVEPEMPSHANDNGDYSALKLAFMELEADDDYGTVLSFHDEDNELVLIRSDNLVLFEAPLICVEPRLWETSLSEETREERTEALSKVGGS